MLQMIKIRKLSEWTKRAGIQINKINSQSDYWLLNYNYKFHCFHTKRRAKEILHRERAVDAKRKRRKKWLLFNGKRRRSKHREKEESEEEEAAEEDNSDDDDERKKPTIRNISQHMAEAVAKWPLAPPTIPIEIYGIQWAMIAHTRRTKAKR